MAKKTESAVRLRKLARQKLDERLAEQRRREKLNEDDLVEFFRLAETVEAATEVRAQAIAAAAEAYKAAVSSAEDDKARRLYAIKERGESVEGLAALTGLSDSQVRGVLRRGKKLSSENDAATSSSGPAASAAARTPAPAERETAKEAGAVPTEPISAPSLTPVSA